MDIKKHFDDLTNLDLGRLTIPGWILILIAIGVAGSSGCTLAWLAHAVANETGQSYRLLPALVIFAVLLAVTFYGGTWLLKLWGIQVLRDRK